MADRALLVGINAYPDAPLSGCVNDVSDMAEFLVEHRDFDPEGIRMLTDKRATTKAILERLQWLVKGAKAGDRLVYHYSGHGVQIPARNPKGEVDGLDECSCPVDFDWEEKVIRDDDYVKLFSTLPKGVKMLWVSDSCHSGNATRSLGSLPPKAPRPKFMVPPADIAWRFRAIARKGIEVKAKFPETVARGPTLPLVYLSGCKSTQTSADAWFGDRPNGALTYYLLRALEAPHGLKEPMREVLKGVRSALKRNDYAQVPQLEGLTSAFALPLLG